jgi:hypothetical protein
MPLMRRRPGTVPTIAAALVLAARTAGAQVGPANVYPPLDDTPSIRLGTVLFVDFTQTLAPTFPAADGNRVSPNAINVTRAYLNLTGQLNHVFAFRMTPDIARETGQGSSLAGSQNLRLKYGYLQVNLDDWLWRGSQARVGMIQTPYVDFEESVYRYRFQGQVFAEREGFLPSSDSGASLRTLLPGGYGEVAGGVYNGEGYTRAEPNDQKALQLRGTLRPWPSAGLARGLRVTFFYDRDHYVRNAERTRAVSLVTYEHRFVNAGWVHLDASDRKTSADRHVTSSGHSFWITPRVLLGIPPTAPPTAVTRASVEGLLRYDRLEPDRDTESAKQRFIAGVAYWPRFLTASVSAALLVDYERVSYHDFAGVQPAERRVGVHMLVVF